MQITVKTAKGHQFAVDVAAGSDGEISIPDLKTAIVERAPASCSFKSDGLALIAAGKVLDNEKKLADYPIVTDGSFIVAMAVKPPRKAGETRRGGGEQTAEDDESVEQDAEEPPPIPDEEEIERRVAVITDMGFSADQARRALVLTRYNSEVAVHILLSGQPLEMLEQRHGRRTQQNTDDGDDEDEGDEGDEEMADAAAGLQNLFGAGGGGGVGSGGQNVGQMLGQMMGLGGGGGGAQQAMAPGNPEYDSLPPGLQELASSPQLPMLQILVRLNPAIGHQVISAIQANHPNVVQAAQENPDAFARLLGTTSDQIGANPFGVATTTSAQTTGNHPNSSAAPAASQSEQSGQSSGYASAVPHSSDPGSFQTPNNAGAVSDTPMGEGSDTASPPAQAVFAQAPPQVGPPPGVQPVQVNPIAPPAPNLNLGPEDDEAIQTLSAMGFSRERCVEAWFACEKNLERAANYLMETMDMGP